MLLLGAATQAAAPLGDTMPDLWRRYLYLIFDGLRPECAREPPQDDDLRGDIRRFTDQLVTALHTPQQREVFLQALVQSLRTLGQNNLATTAARWHSPHEPGSTPA